jgi:hypothetical protein
MSNAFMIDSFGSRSRRNRITASTYRDGGAELRAALGFVGLDRDPVPVFAAQVTDDHVKSEPTTGAGSNSDRRLAHLLYPWRFVQNHRTAAETNRDDKLLACRVEF